MKKEVEPTDDVTKEFLVNIINFIEKSIDDVKTRGDAMLLNILSNSLNEYIGFYDKEGGIDENIWI